MEFETSVTGEQVLSSLGDEDAHFCLRCRSTIIGLDRYVLHRREKCQSSFAKEPETNQASEPPVIPQRNVPIPRFLPVTSSRSDPVLSSSSNHIEERLNLSVEVPIDDFMNHLGLCMVSSSTWGGDIHSEEPLRADDFFSLLELQSCAKPQAKMLKSSGNKPSQLKAVEENGSLHHIDDLSTHDLDSSRITDTSSPIISGAEGAFDVSVDEEQLDLTNDCLSTAENPQSLGNMENAKESNESMGTTRVFPSRGKWMPGLKPGDIHKSGCSVEYDCKPCNRRLTGRVVYEKHLQSELHFKRVAQSQSKSLESPPQSHQEEHYTLRRKTASGRSPEALEAPEVAVKIVKDALEEDSDLWWMKRKKQDKNAQRCPTCQVWVSRSVFGKHLVSQFHVLRSLKHPQRDQCIRDHIQQVVREAPFQCRLCRFYCHSHQDLLSHWRSEMHCKKDELTKGGVASGNYFCGLCRLSTGSKSSDMDDHLNSEQHLRCVNIVNKSVAVVINKLVAIQCHLCADTFRYHIQLNRHLNSVHSDQLASTTHPHPRLLNTSEVFKCQHCNYRSSSRSAFTHHLFSCRSVPSEARLYRCLICRLSFPSKQQVMRHRSSQEHRDAARSHRCGGSSPVRLRSCPHCYQSFSSLTQLKDHFTDAHADLLPRCTGCGATFALKQQLSAHRRGNCVGVGSNESLALSCEDCSYRCQRRVDLLYHRAIEHRQLSENGSVGDKYDCPECGLKYTRASLKAHLISHTRELPCRCSHCGRHFRQEHQLQAHIRHLHASTKSAASSSTTSSFHQLVLPPSD